MSGSTHLKSGAASQTAHYRPETRLVHSGTLRSEFGETSEGLAERLGGAAQGYNAGQTRARPSVHIM